MTVPPALPRVLGVVGAGQMGAGIAQVAATAGLSVHLVDASAEGLTRGLAAISASLRRLAKKGQLEAGAAEAALRRIQTGTDLAALESSDYVVEAVPEREDVKASLFRSLDRLLLPQAILASNTSSISLPYQRRSITRLAAATSRPDRVIGLHFMNPVPLMPLVEVIRGLHTSEATFAASRGLAAALGKATCVAADRPGFIVNRILMPMINEAFFALMEGVASAEDIDAGLRLGTNQPQGPLALADLIGLDTCLAIMQTLHSGLGEDKYRPCPLLQSYVDAGWLGRKSGRGVYEYKQ